MCDNECPSALNREMLFEKYMKVWEVVYNLVAQINCIRETEKRN
jgi:hypothetical protein